MGILPGRDRSEANEWVQVAVPTGLGETRNALVVMGADAVIAFPGRHGTLSEIAFALLVGTPVVAVDAWHELRDDGVVVVATAAEAVARALGM